MKDTYNVLKVWRGIRPKIITGFPPERSKILCFIHIYGENFVPKEEYSAYILEAYDLFRDEIIVDGFLSVLEFATMVAGSGTDNLMKNLYDWAHDEKVRYTRIPYDLAKTVYDFEFMCGLITEFIKKNDM